MNSDIKGWKNIVMCEIKNRQILYKISVIIEENALLITP